MTKRILLVSLAIFIPSLLAAPQTTHQHPAFLSFLVDPVLLYLLLLIGIYALFFELAHPGFIIPGAIGVLALCAVLLTFRYSPVDYSGLTLLLVGMACMIGEILYRSYIILGLFGILSFMLGSVILFHAPDFHLTWPLITIMTILTFTFFFTVLTRLKRERKEQIAHNKLTLVGHEGVVVSFRNRQFIVKVDNEIWQAESPQPLQIGERIRVTDVNHLTLIIERKT